MRIYLVGGAVRDQLLGLPISERDWVVVGSSPRQLLDLGYQTVGRDFPVFLHPETGEEYALARTERKTGVGYHGFSFHYDPKVTLEEDLLRRDLTINAMARSAEGKLIDPYGGRRDLERRVLRHVSPAFDEDPLRALRAARFAARFHELGFRIAKETSERMRAIAESGELDALTPERVFQELRRALMEPNPETFVSALAKCGAWQTVFPLLSDPVTVARTLRAAAQAKISPTARFACLSWHSRDVEAWCDAIRAPRALAKAGALLRRLFPVWADLDPEDPAAVLALLESLDATRRPEQFEDFSAAAATLGPVFGLDRARADHRLRIARAALLDCDEKSAAQRIDHRTIGERVREARLDAVRAALMEDQ